MKDQSPPHFKLQTQDNFTQGSSILQTADLCELEVYFFSVKYYKNIYISILLYKGYYDIYFYIKHILLPILSMMQCMHRISVLAPDVIRFKYATSYIYDL